MCFSIIFFQTCFNMLFFGCFRSSIILHGSDPRSEDTRNFRIQESHYYRFVVMIFFQQRFLSSFVGVLIDLTFEFLVLIIKSFDNQNTIILPRPSIVPSPPSVPLHSSSSYSYNRKHGPVVWVCVITGLIFFLMNNNR